QRTRVSTSPGPASRKLARPCIGANPYAGSNDAAPGLQLATPSVVTPGAESDTEGGSASNPGPDEHEHAQRLCARIRGLAYEDWNLRPSPLERHQRPLLLARIVVFD